MDKHLVIVQLFGVVEVSKCWEMMGIHNEAVVWNDEIVPEDARAGEHISLHTTHPEVDPTSMNGILDEDLNQRAGILKEILTVEDSEPWKDVHRPYIGEIR